MQKTKRYYLRKKGQIPSANQVTKSKVTKTKFYILIPHAGERKKCLELKEYDLHT